VSARLRWLWRPAISAAAVLLLLQLSTVQRPPSVRAQVRATTYAVVIGIQANAQIHSGWVPFADNDARNFSEYLIRKGVDRANIELLVNERAGRNQVLDALQKTLIVKAGVNDTVYLFFSARGRATQGDRGSIQAYASAGEKGPTTGIQLLQIKSWLDSRNAPRVIVYADVCRESPDLDPDNRINYRASEIGGANPRVFGILASQPKRSSCEVDTPPGHGIFTDKLIAGLRGAADSNHDGTVTLDELARFLDRDVPAASKVAPCRQKPQVPLSFGNADRRKVEMADARVLPPDRGSSPSPATPSLFRLVAAQTGDDAMTLHLRFMDALDAGLLDGPRGASSLLGMMRRFASADAGKLWNSDRDRLAAAYADRGEVIFASYGTGDQFPDDPNWIALQPSSTDFRSAASDYATAASLKANPEWEARANFCAGRAALLGTALSGSQRPSPPDADALRRAGELFSMALSSDGRLAEVHNGMGIVWLNTGDLKAAADSFGKAIELSPEWAFPRHNLALTYIEQGNYRAAERSYTDAAAATPYYPYLFYNRAVLLQRLNRLGEAAGQFRRALKVFAEQVEKLERRAQEWRGLGKHETDAVYADKMAVVLRRNQAEASNALGTLAEARGKDDDAERAYIDANTLAKDLTLPRHNLAELYRERARKQKRDAQRRVWLDKAIGLWTDAVGLDPAFAPARLGLAQLYLEDGKYKLALEAFQAASAISEDWHTRQGEALALSGEKRFAEAVTVVRNAIQSGPSQAGAIPELRETLGDIYVLAGDRDSACVQFRAARRGERSRKELRAKLRKCPP
jgi:tetratricopeptide (TPR) repeat protein